MVRLSRTCGQIYSQYITLHHEQRHIARTLYFMRRNTYFKVLSYRLFQMSDNIIYLTIRNTVSFG